MKIYFPRMLADYGGALNAGLCLLHCAAGPLLLAWWSGTGNAAVPPLWEGVFLLLSGGLVIGSTWQLPMGPRRWALWAFLGLFAATTLLAERWPWLEPVQYAASLGLLGTHLLNLRYGRRATNALSCNTCAAQRDDGGVTDIVRVEKYEQG